MFTTGLGIFCLTANIKPRLMIPDLILNPLMQVLSKALAWVQWNASDLCSAHQSNLIFRYANDTYLIVPDTHLHTIPLELQHISDWANRHNLKLNQSKSKEMIISLHNGPVSTVNVPY